jgi:hypothetical protein
MHRHATSDARFEIRERRDGHKSLHARADFLPGETLVWFSPRVTLPEPAVHTIQMNESDHILLEPQFLEYTNHSCSPNVVFDVSRMVVTAVEPIATGDEIVYFYPSTEASMSRPFSCYCDSPHCLGLIEGAEYLAPEVLDRYQLSDHIRTLRLRPAAA